MATNFSPSSGSYVLNKFPSISQWSDTGPSWPSCWSLRSEKQMDIKPFTEFFKKKNDPSKNMAFMEDSFTSYGNQISESI